MLFYRNLRRSINSKPYHNFLILLRKHLTDKFWFTGNLITAGQDSDKDWALASKNHTSVKNAKFNWKL